MKNVTLSEMSTQTGLSREEVLDRLYGAGLSLDKYADPVEDARQGLARGDAEEVAAEDPGLLYADRALAGAVLPL